MLGPVRSLVVAVIGLALLPAVAGADATVARDSGTGLLEIVGDAGEDEILVERTSMFDIVSRDGGGLTAGGDCTGGGNVVQCPRGSSIAVDLGAGNDRFDAGSVPAPINVAGGADDDFLATGGGHDVLAGGTGDDTLDGRGGVDDYFGETGDDTIEARDRAAERISCGQGSDEARNDFVDIIAECERGIDADGDGFSSAVDCNDGARTISPGAPEVFDNGIDENCDGRDNPDLDGDNDGFARPQDCDDANGAIRPNVPEIRGNAADENCDRRAEPFADLGVVVANQWEFSRSFARLQRLVVINAPRRLPNRVPLRRP